MHSPILISRYLAGVAVIACAAALIPGAALAITTSPAAKPAHPVTAYVVNAGSIALGDTVTPIDTATGAALRPIKVGLGADAIAITPDGKTAYVISGRVPCGTCAQETPADTVTPIRTATGTALKPIKVRHPSAIAITPNGKTAYVSDGGNGTGRTVTPIDTATNTALRPIKLGGQAGTIAITPNGKTAYVATGEDMVTAIRTATNTALTTIKVGNGPGAIAITPNGKTAYVLSVFSETVTPIRTATNTALKAIRFGKPTAFGTSHAIAITPDGKTAYVLDASDFNSSSGTVTPIDTATNTTLKPIKVRGLGNAIAITPDGKTAYVLSRAGVTPIRTATNTALKAIKIKGLLVNIAIAPDGETAYVVNDVFLPGDTPATVIPIRTATGRAGTPITVGSGAGPIAFAP